MYTCRYVRIFCNLNIFLHQVSFSIHKRIYCLLQITSFMNATFAVMNLNMIFCYFKEFLEFFMRIDSPQ